MHSRSAFQCGDAAENNGRMFGVRPALRDPPVRAANQDRPCGAPSIRTSAIAITHTAVHFILRPRARL